MSTPQLHLHLATLEKGPVQLDGTLPASVLDLSDEVSIRNIGEVVYHLTAEKKSQEILIRGAVEAPMDLECARSGVFFSTKVGESAFLRDYSMKDLQDPLDLTEDVREAIVINIPPYPVSPEARSKDFVPPGIVPDEDEEGPEPESSPWTALDDLNLPPT